VRERLTLIVRVIIQLKLIKNILRHFLLLLLLYFCYENVKQKPCMAVLIFKARLKQ